MVRITRPASIFTGTIVIAGDEGNARIGMPAAATAPAPSDEPMKLRRVITMRSAACT